MAADSPNPHKVVRFGAYEADLRRGELRKFGLRLKLQEQPFQVLSLLLENPGEMVAREELRERIWSTDTFVDFDNGVNKAIAKLRTALGDDPANPRFIETVPRRGYRFIAPVQAVESEAAAASADLVWAESNSQQTAAASKPFASLARRQTKMRISGRVIALWCGAFLLVVMGGVTIFLRIPRPAQATTNAIAVLPLENLSGDPGQDYFAEGMTDALINDLARIKSERVIPLSMVKRLAAEHTAPGEMARELKVDAIVRGSVTRVGDRVRITARLSDPASDRDLWVKSYDSDFKDLVAEQIKLAWLIANEIHASLDPEEERFFAGGEHVPTPAAYDAYLRGHYLFTKFPRSWDEAQRACRYFHEAIAADSSFAPAYVAMAQCQQWEQTRGVIAYGESKVREFAQRAVELAPAWSESHAALGAAYMWHDWNWPQAEQELRRALELNPNSAETHFSYAECLKIQSRLPEALAQARRAQELDPLTFRYFTDAAYYLMYMGRFDDAEIEFRKVLQVWPESGSALTGLAATYEKKGMWEQAAQEWQKFIDVDDAQLHFHFYEMYKAEGYATARRRYFETDAAHARSSLARGYVWENFHLAYLYARLGNKEKALDFLSRSYDARLPQMANLKVDDRFESLRAEPRFHDLLRQMRLE